MINIEIGLNQSGVLGRLSATGHSNRGPKGSDIVCASVSALLRTTARVLAQEPGLSVKGRAEQEGSFNFSVTGTPSNGIAWLKGVTDVLLKGLGDIQAEFPDLCKLMIFQVEE